MRQIDDFATHALISGAVGLFCGVLAILGGPMSIWRGTRALSMIEQHGVGREHAWKAHVGRALGALSLLALMGAFVYFVFVAPG